MGSTDPSRLVAVEFSLFGNMVHMIRIGIVPANVVPEANLGKVR